MGQRGGFDRTPLFSSAEQDLYLLPRVYAPGDALAAIEHHAALIPGIDGNNGKLVFSLTPDVDRISGIQLVIRLSRGGLYRGAILGEDVIPSPFCILRGRQYGPVIYPLVEVT